MIEFENNQNFAYFDANEHGRILCANKRFCRMFGFEEDQVSWHYLNDLYRFKKDFEFYTSNKNVSSCNFIAKMRNRKGRSFKCCIEREILKSSTGTIIYRNKIYRVDESIVLKESSKESQAVPSSIVFLTKCTHCGGQVTVNSMAEAHLKTYCRLCAEKLCPEAFNLKTAQM